MFANIKYITCKSFQTLLFTYKNVYRQYYSSIRMLTDTIIHL